MPRPIPTPSAPRQSEAARQAPSARQIPAATPTTATPPGHASPATSALAWLWLALAAGTTCSDVDAGNSGAATGGDVAGAEATGADVADTEADVSVPGTGLKILTFNVLCSFCAKPDHDPWSERIPALQDVIARHDADLMGLQELFSFEAGDDSEVLAMMGADPAYTALYYHVTPTDVLDMDYPDATVYVRTARFDVIESGTFWLSPTPDVAFSTGFAPSGQLPRLVAWARLDDKVSGRELVFASTHVDNNAPSQALSAPLILERLAPIAADTQVILVGDFNADPGHVAWQTLTDGVDGKGLALVDAFEVAQSWDVDSDTETKADYDPSERIDHIFFSKGGLATGGTFDVPKWTVDMQRYGSKSLYPSDHFAIVAELAAP